jgi:hypothetical protein
MLRTVVKWLVIGIVVVVLFDAISNDPTAAGHTVGGLITGFFHFCGKVATFIGSI